MKYRANRQGGLRKYEEPKEEPLNNGSEGEQQPEQEKSKFQQDSENNEELVRNAAEVAQASGNPYAMAAGTAVKAADKITGGKSTQFLGKATTVANRITPGGNKIQKLTNRSAKNGSMQLAGKVAAMKNSKGAGAAGAAENASKASGIADKINKANTGGGQKSSLPSSGGKNNDSKSSGFLKNAIGKKFGKSKDDKSVILKIIASNPWILIVLGIILVVFFIILIVVVDDDPATPSETYGLAGYNYYHVENLCETVKVSRTLKNGTVLSAEVDFEKEYIPGVVLAEISYFANDPDMGKLFAVAARSFAINNLSKDCEIDGSDMRQAFEFDDEKRNKVVNDPNSPIMQAVNETYGLVYVKENGKLSTANYDAACYRGEDDNYYFLGYGSITLGEEHQQSVPKSWAETQNGLMGYINEAKANNKMCYGNHGYGISTYGAKYLSEEQNYNYIQLLEFYFGKGELYSIYKTNYNMETSSGTNDILSTDLGTFLKQKGTSVEAFNEYALSQMLEYGFGTREAVVAFATAIVGGLYENYQARLPYTLCGQHGCMDMYDNNNTNVNRSGTSFYGVDPNWGSEIHNRSDGLYHYSDKRYNNAVYSRYGPDCSGFVSWVLHNAGFNNSVMGADDFTTLGPTKDLAGTKVAKAGDLIHRNGHIMLVVGVDESQKVYYIAHAAGGSEGVKINALEFDSPGNEAIDMTNFYNTHKSNITVEDYRNGYIGGYTGESGGSFVSHPVDKGVYFVGDSRTVGVCYVTKQCSDTNNCVTSTCNAKIGSSKTWFDEQIGKINSSNKGNIVIAMGVNDLVNTSNAEGVAESYFESYKKVANNNRAKKIYIMSVNPVGEDSVVKPSNVTLFNNKMQRLISSSNISNLKYLNTFNKIDYELEGDGIHYSFNTYQRIYDYVMGVI